MAENDNLTGNLLEFHRSSPLKELSTWGISFSGIVPDSTCNLESISFLDLSGCNFSGMLPASLGSVTKLTVLDLGSNQFWGQIPTSLGNLSQLTFLDLRENNFDVPTLPLTLGKLSKLTRLYLNSQTINYKGMIPSSISQLKYLEDLNFAGNNLGGKVELDIFLKHRNILHLDLSANKLTVLTKNSTNATIPKFNILGLASCNLKKFPNFLQFQDELEMFSFSDNKIHGEIPTWFWNKSKETMVMVDLLQNFLTGFEQHPDVIPWWSLISLDLSFNILQGSLPIPPPSIHVYQCFSVSAQSKSQQFSRHYSSHDGINLKMIDLSQNHLHGLVSRSLENCTLLEILVLGNNQMKDTFPSWLGALPMLQVLIL
ncbi:receptor-like protein 7 [Camellia sinensis]|uniref:receptor-like protein 7 n=1 Tax=Camellia sinensis TaxID=4442 RepID=UPI001036E1CB|nr:receptor-like protein 7 [Camellia sinensis]